MSFHKKSDPRFVHREQQRQRAVASPSLSACFPQLKSMTMDITYHGFQPYGRARLIRCTLNLEKTHSVFHLDCDNVECVGGDFDLSRELAGAVATRQKVLSGELVCQGWASRTQIEQRRCHSRVHYELKLNYGGRATHKQRKKHD